MIPLRHIALAIASLLAAPSAFAEPAAQSNDIVVQARDRAVIEKFVRGLADPARTGQIAKWEDGVCPGVIGLQADQAEALNARIGELARLGRLKPDKEGCTPSILIIFTPDAGALARGFQARFPITLGREGRWRLAEFARSDRPVRWISQVDIAPFDGSQITKGFGMRPDQGRMSGSRIQLSTRAVLSFMLIIVDATQIEHVSLGSLSDYLAMVALTRPKFGGKPPSQSILALFDGDREAAAGLTDFDRSYLASFYKAPIDVSASMQASAIQGMMKRNPPPAPPNAAPEGH